MVLYRLARTGLARTDRGTLRRISRFLRRAEPAVNGVGLVAILVFICSLLPRELLAPGPATGGDTGSHFWTLKVLVEQGLTQGSIRVANPGNQCGQPLLVHYFPLPFLVMAAFTYLLPLGMSFNLGTLLGLIGLPFCVFACLRMLGARFPIPLIAAGLSLSFLFNESFSMWGGNALSVLAGQFAHGYGLCFLLLGVGALAQEIRLSRAPIWSAFLFAATFLSHGYPALGIPVFMLSLLFFVRGLNFKRRLWWCLTSGLSAVLLSIWFLVPMIENKTWTTAYTFSWGFTNILLETAPQIFYPAIVILVVGASFVFIQSCRGLNAARRDSRFLSFWFIPSVFYVGLYFVLPRIGLIDIRAVPQVELFVCIMAACALRPVFRAMGRVTAWMLSLPLLILSIWWADMHVENFPRWASWNYSGWQSKPLYSDLQNLTLVLKGDFSKPRVVFELSAVNDKTGTIRVFEMLPYFASRATLESVYIEGTILAPETVRLQAEVSKFPSCPFAQYDCPHYDVGQTAARLKLMGVGELILVTEEVVAQARNSSFLQETGTYGPWHLFHLKDQPRLVDVFRNRPLLTSSTDWREEFYNWFKAFDGASPMLVATELLSEEEKGGLMTPGKDDPWDLDSTCEPTLKVGFNKLILDTPCPGKAHYLKFAYHPTWKANTGDHVFMASPGFLALIPSKPRVILSFGESLAWKASNLVSVISTCALLGGQLLLWIRRRRRSLGPVDK